MVFAGKRLCESHDDFGIKLTARHAFDFGTDPSAALTFPADIPTTSMPTAVPSFWWVGVS